jgi:hypothetical protein
MTMPSSSTASMIKPTVIPLEFTKTLAGPGNICSCGSLREDPARQVIRSLTIEAIGLPNACWCCSRLFPRVAKQRPKSNPPPRERYQHFHRVSGVLTVDQSDLDYQLKVTTGASGDPQKALANRDSPAAPLTKAALDADLLHDPMVAPGSPAFLPTAWKERSVSVEAAATYRFPKVPPAAELYAASEIRFRSMKRRVAVLGSIRTVTARAVAAEKLTPPRGGWFFKTAT